jgi:hypothetical protein
MPIIFQAFFFFYIGLTLYSSFLELLVDVFYKFFFFFFDMFVNIFEFAIKTRVKYVFNT